MSSSLAFPHRPLVWITDDDPIEANHTERALGASYACERFASGADVVAQLTSSSRQPDVLLLDWAAPCGTGEELCRLLRSQPHTKDLPIILVGPARLDTASIGAGLQLGANDFVARQVEADELRVRVDNAIRRKRLRETAARERNRLDVIYRLGRAFVDAGDQIDGVLDVLATALVDGICDRCTISVMPGLVPKKTLSRERAGLQPEGTAEPRNTAVISFPPGSPVAGIVTLIREQGSSPFEPEDIVTTETCLEYAALALEKAVRFDVEQGMRKQLETILGHLPISIIVAEPSGAITHMNQTSLDLSPAMRGAASVDALVERITLRTLDGEALEDGMRPLKRALAGEAVRGLELEARFAGGRSRFLRTSAVPLFDAQGAVSSAILAFDDITAERTAAAEREQIMEFQRYVLGIVSHDMRSPLQTLVMGCEGIRMNVTSPTKIHQFVDLMESTTLRMSGIIEQLLDVVRTQLGGGIPVTRSEVDLGDVVTSVIGELALAYPAARFEQRLDRVRGHWDRDRLAQVVANLVGNALQHGAKSTPIWIETEQVGEHALLRVRNRGTAALSPEQMTRIFDPFRRTAPATGGKGGLGLGLYIATEILRAHDGEITVESDASTTTFVVRLPIRPTATA